MTRFAASLALLAFTAACAPAPKQELDPGAETIARQFYEDVHNGADLDGDTHVARELKNGATEQQLALFRSMMPSEPERSIDVQSWDASTNSVGTTTRLTIAYGYSDRTLIAQTALFKSPGGSEPVIVGFNVFTRPAES